MHLGEIYEGTFIINSCDGARRQIRDVSELSRAPNDSEIDRDDAPPATTMAANLRDRIADLEQSLFEERRALQECEEDYRELEMRFNGLQQKQS